MTTPKTPSGENHLDFWLEHLPSEPSFVYVIQADPEDPIKVGIAKDPRSRLRSLQTAHWKQLHLLYVVPGSRDIEAEFHRRLGEARVSGEWFSGEMAEGFLAWIADYADRAVSAFRETGAFPSVRPLQKRLNRLGFGPQGFRSCKLGHRWRTSDGRRNPVTVRYVKPEPRPQPTAAEVEEKQRRALQRAIAKRPAPPLNI